MSHGKASHRLFKDILFNLIKDKPCYRCGEVLTRETFSIEHKVPWLDSDNPVELFFDLTNIDFSHLKCNVLASRKVGNKSTNRGHGKNYGQGFSKEEQRLRDNESRRKTWNSLPKEERQRRRRERYKKYKC